MLDKHMPIILQMIRGDKFTLLVLRRFQLFFSFLLVFELSLFFSLTQRFVVVLSRRGDEVAIGWTHAACAV